MMPATTVQSIFSNRDTTQNPVPLKLNYDTLDAGGHHVPDISDQELNVMSIYHVKGCEFITDCCYNCSFP